MIRISAGECKDFDSLQHREWIEVNGLGGYASSTLLNCHSRKYHGLLVSNLESPGGRFVLLSKYEDSVSLEGKDFFLTIHRYPMTYYPAKKHWLDVFELDICPRFIYKIRDNVMVVKEIMFVHGENTLLVRYCLEGTHGPLTLKVRPLIAYRDIHSLSKENGFIHGKTQEGFEGIAMEPYDGMPRLHMDTSTASPFESSPAWYRQFEYIKEKDRGFACLEDLFMPGQFNCTLEPSSHITFRTSTAVDERPIDKLWNEEAIRRNKIKENARRKDVTSNDISERLYLSAEDYLIRNRRKNRSIIAGYHWFYEWGRDTLISLPGLTFHTGRIDEGIEILETFGNLCKQGLVPNNLSETDEEGSFNSVDASLWYFWCVQQFLGITGNITAVMKKFWPVLLDIASAFIFEPAENLFLLDNGLIQVGNASTQLTWMDAMVRGVPVTPRNGCPVEINALWFNALSFLNRISLESGNVIPFDIARLIASLESAFTKLFWIPDKGFLADGWSPEDGSRDESLRPNQIFALSLPFNILKETEKGRKIMKRISNELYTPLGLRTLSPEEPMYQGKYGGPPEERDAAYHQGTVWPWLLGHYGEALLRFFGNAEWARSNLSTAVSALEHHLCEAGIGHVSEIFSGNPPHEPDGCIAQAWSMAELIRLKTLMRTVA